MDAFVRAAAATLLFALGGAPAQAPSPWATLAVPTGVQPTQATSLGKLVAYSDGGTLYAWSAVTRAWASHPVRSQATLRLNNDCLLAQQPGSWIAFSAFTGTFAARTVSAGAVLHNPVGAQNDAMLAFTDQGQVHVYCATDGHWRARAVQSNALVALQRNVLVLQQGTLLSAMDAATGQWHDRQAAVAPTALSADGSLGLAWSGAGAHAFSALHRTWTDATIPGGATFVRADDWAVFAGADRTIACSAITGGFAAIAVGGLQPTATSDLVGLFDDGAALRAFSAVRGGWSDALAPRSALATVRGPTALLVGPAGAVGYSALTNTAEPIDGPVVSSGAADTVAWARTANGAGPSLFSAFTAGWVDAPAGWTTDPQLATTAAATVTGAGCVAFSPRTGRFVPLACAGAQLFGNPSSALLLAVTPTDAHAFDARRERWVSTPRNGVGVVAAQIWRTAGVVIDGVEALAFGAQSGAWSRTALPGPATSLRTNSECVRVTTAFGVHAATALPQAGWFAQFPEFRRVQPAGATASWWSGAPPGGGVVVAAVGLPVATPWTVPGLGPCWLDPADVLIGPVHVLAAGSGAFGQLPAPSTWPCQGVEFALQSACLPAAGAPYLGDPATLRPQ
jgi:hypothetical protein